MLQPSQVMAAEWLMFALAYIMVALRAFVRVSAKQTHLWLSEVLLLFAALSLLGLLICDTLTYQLGAMSDFAMFDERLGKIRFATNYFFDTGLYLPKLSMLAIYSRLIPRHENHFRWAFYVVTAFVVSAMLFTAFADTFWCGKDPSVNWSTDPDACSTFTALTLMDINWSICIASEALIFLLPIPLVRRSKSLGRRQEVGLIVLFTLGIITMVVSTGRYITMKSTGNDISIYVWATTEFSVSIMVVACMALRPLVAKAHRMATGLATGSNTRSNQRSSIKAFTGSNTRSNQRSSIKAFTGSRADPPEPPDSQIELNDLNLQPCGNQIIKTNHICVSSERQSTEEGSQGPSRDWERDPHADAV